MNTLLRLEELAIFVGSIYLFANVPYSWWLFPLLLLVPDISMLGYVIGPRIGAYVYNAGHTRITAILVLLAGSVLQMNGITLVGIILLAHGAMDRMLGYGLKHSDSFCHTHLGMIGSHT